MFREIFIYGKDVFLMGLGAQLITASQTIIISRTLGLDAAAAWTIGTRVFLLVRQLVFQPYAAANAGLCEMVARDETERLKYRFKNLVSLTASLGVFLGIAFALCNSLFVHIWTSGKISWSPLNDILLAVWVVFTSLQVPHCNFVTVTKKIGVMRYLYFIEGCCFVTASLLLASRWGISEIIGCSVVCLIFFSYQFGLRRSHRYFHVRISELAFDWIRPSLKLAATLIPFAVIIWFATSSLPELWRLIVHAVAVTLAGGFLFLRLGLSPEMIQEMKMRVPRVASRLLEILVPRAA
jgi:O-antigen/teichoic acid export membrane protein